MNRRKFIGAGASVLAGGAGLFGYATLIEPHWLEIVSRDLPIANLPPELSGKTLAHISDLHICSYVDENYLSRSLARIAAFNPDITVITGDFVSWQAGRSDRIRIPELHRVLSNLPKSPLGTIGILGNHDYSNTWEDMRVAKQITDLVSQHGVRVLRNQVATIGGLDFIGIDELWAGQADTVAAFKQRKSSAAIALCHNPDGADHLPWTGYSGWILSGHTHGGQCKPPFLPPPLLPVENRRYTAGEIEVDATRKLYISRGVGHLLKARFNVRPEITLFTMRAA